MSFLDILYNIQYRKLEKGGKILYLKALKGNRNQLYSK